jgi:hypothetical protein
MPPDNWTEPEVELPESVMSLTTILDPKEATPETAKISFNVVAADTFKNDPTVTVFPTAKPPDVIIDPVVVDEESTVDETVKVFVDSIPANVALPLTVAFPTTDKLIPTYMLFNVEIPPETSNAAIDTPEASVKFVIFTSPEEVKVPVEETFPDKFVNEFTFKVPPIKTDRAIPIPPAKMTLPVDGEIDSLF